MHKYRTHTCSELTKKDAGKTVKLSGWIHRKRDHGNLLFFDLRDHYGLTQCVTENSAAFFREIEKALTQGKRIEIRGFGSFFTKTRNKRIGINPQNRKNIEIEKKVRSEVLDLCKKFPIYSKLI